MTFSRHMARRFDDERFRQRFQSVVPRELERINAIVDGLLRLARPARLVLAPVHLAPLVEQALELYAPQIEGRRIRVRREWSVGLPPVAGGPRAPVPGLPQSRGERHRRDGRGRGATLTVRVELAPGMPRASAAAFRDRLVLEVEDTGSGIKPEETADVFNPFFTTKAGGTGLGLAITHKIVEDHGGTVTFRSTPGQGTVFTVTLPVRAGRRADHPVSGEWRIGSQLS